jgi:photosystem II stability/assembly factor-like uncharacterized protein
MPIARTGPHSGIISEGGEGGPTTLLQTADDGRTWQQLADPCQDLVVVSLVAATASRWNLYCTLDGGMNQGTVELFTSTDVGQLWTLTAEGRPEGQQTGTIGDGLALDLAASGDGTVLWLPNSAGGLAVSTDGGVQWTDTDISSRRSEALIATAEDHQAWLPVPFDGLWHTTDGTHYRRHPLGHAALKPSLLPVVRGHSQSSHWSMVMLVRRLSAKQVPGSADPAPGDSRSGQPSGPDRAARSRPATGFRRARPELSFLR